MTRKNGKLPENITSRLAKPVAVFGGGVSGSGAAKLLARLDVPAVVYDERGAGGGLNDFGAAEAARHALVICSPGFSQQHPWLVAARRANALCVGELDFASLFWNKRVVAVTGTNGKTTLAEFLVFAHKRAGQAAIAAGNIGYPLSRVFELEGNREPLLVCEVSSFQAEDMRFFAPDVLLWTNFDEDHLDRHRTLETYFRAKYKLVERLVANNAPSTGAKRLIIGEDAARRAKEFDLPLPDFAEIVTAEDIGPPAPPPVARSTPRPAPRPTPSPNATGSAKGCRSARSPRPPTCSRRRRTA